jgi:hypothetical protein
VLPHTLGLGPDVWRVLARSHDLRNRGEYEGNLDVDERLLTDLIAACKIVASALAKLPAFDMGLRIARFHAVCERKVSLTSQSSVCKSPSIWSTDLR